MNLNKFENAQDDFKKVLKLEPTNKAAKNLSLSCSQKMKPEEKSLTVSSQEPLPNYCLEYESKYGKDDRNMYLELPYMYAVSHPQTLEFYVKEISTELQISKSTGELKRYVLI